MLRAYLKAFSLLLVLGLPTLAVQRNFGLGVVLGDPTGISGKLWTSNRTALDFAVGWHGGYWGREYYDPRCERESFRNNQPTYCEDRYYGYRDGYGRGWEVFHLHADYLFHNFKVIHARDRVPLYYGPGLNFNYWDYDVAQIGVRGNFGLAWMPRNAPLDLFLELAPVMNIIPYPDFDLDAGLGIRFYF